MHGKLMLHSAVIFLIHHKIKAWLPTSSITSMPMLGLSFAMIWFIGKFCWQHLSSQNQIYNVSKEQTEQTVDALLTGVLVI